jgi:hypothetical protein
MSHLLYLCAFNSFNISNLTVNYKTLTGGFNAHALSFSFLFFHKLNKICTLYSDTLGNKEEIQAHVEVCEALGKKVAQNMISFCDQA